MYKIQFFKLHFYRYPILRTTQYFWYYFTGDHLEVHYVGRLNDENGEKFDASRDRGQLFKFQLGAGQVTNCLTF